MARRNSRGFSMLELLVALSIMLVLFGMALPKMFNAVRTYRLMGDARGIATQLAVARMRAASSFTQARLNVNVNAGTYQIELFNKSTSSFAVEGGVQYLSSGTTFGLGSISTPAGTQTTIAESALILFNSRGIPVDSSGAPTGTYALYLSNPSGQYYAVTVFASGKVNIWRFSGTAWVRV